MMKFPSVKEGHRQTLRCPDEGMGVASPTNSDVKQFHDVNPPQPSPTSAARFAQTQNETHEKRARRRREEAVSRLVADATRPPDFLSEENITAAADEILKPAVGDAHLKQESNYAKLEARLRSQQHSTLLLASTVASSIERGLDRELHSELVRQGKDAQSVISKICHDHSEDFLESVGKVVSALGGPCEEVRASLEEVRF